ncbi:MAG: CPBP family intramembrane metalloprotease [Lachnospiraceae bacterium]|nr:CPBP family intramembrane metalloprotease [Lachnospiraceae bacterium]
MNKLYDKNELHFSLVWIGLYVVLLSVGDSISAFIGIPKLVTALICIILTAFLYLWIHKNNLEEKYGLCKLKGEPKQYLYFIPLLLLVSVNLWWGINHNLSLLEIVFFVLSMLCVGFLEEVIFRGFLFKAICQTNENRAIIISGVTFGFGHIVNLLNGRDVFSTLLQICYAVAIGILFTIIFYKGKSLWPCIITHSAINSLSFLNQNQLTMQRHIAVSVFLCVVSIGYTVYILKKNR